MTTLTDTLEVTPEMIIAEVTPEIKQNRELYLRVMEQKLLRSMEKKEEADEKFRNKNFAGAITTYSEGLLVISFENFKELDDMNLQRRILEVFTKTLNNTSQCFIALEKWDEALQVCQQVMQLDPSDLKSYYRAGMCLKNMGKLRESYFKLEEGSRVAKTRNKPLTEEYVSLKNTVAREINSETEMQRNLYKNALGNKANSNQNTGSNSLAFFPIVGCIGGAASFFALNAFPATKSMDQEHKIAVSTAVGTGLGGLSIAEKPVWRVLSLASIVAGAAIVAHRILDIKK